MENGTTILFGLPGVAVDRVERSMVPMAVRCG